MDACLCVLQEKSKMQEEDTKKMMYNNYDWFLHQVHLLAPTPPELEKHYLRVYNVYKDIICTKKNKQLFALKEAKNSHLSMFNHI